MPERRRQLIYEPNVFAQKDLDTARWVILTPAPEMTVEQRWEVETPWVVERLQFPGGNSVILDWGCGVGRLARPLLERGHYVVGVDISTNMLGHAFQKAGPRHFAGIPPSIFRRTMAPAVFDGGYASWVLQHVQHPHRDIALIAKVLKPGAPFYLLNSERRFIPVRDRDDPKGKVDWIGDEYNVAELMAEYFDLEKELELAPFIPPRSYFRLYRRKP
jgi:SAM-dependent methyltransferase